MEKTKLLIETVNNEINSYTPWVSRKEIAAWTAIALYLALIWSFIGFIFNNIATFTSNIDMFLLVFVSPILVILISTIFALFIHSQFSSIYDKTALTNALRKNIYKLIKLGDIDSIDLSFNNIKWLPQFVIEDYQSQRRSSIRIQPLDNLINLWTFRWFRKKEQAKLSTHQKQETLIYSLIILSCFIFFVIRLRIILHFVINIGS